MAHNCYRIKSLEHRIYSLVKFCLYKFDLCYKTKKILSQFLWFLRLERDKIYFSDLSFSERFKIIVQLLYDMMKNMCKK